MKRRWLLLLFVLLVNAALAQNSTTKKSCIAFSPGVDAAGNADFLAKEPLSTAVTLSGDFDFYESAHEGCWTVHVLSLRVASGTGEPMGYAVSFTVTNPSEVELDHGLFVAPDTSVFELTMRKAAASAIKNIRSWKLIWEATPTPQPK